MSEKGANAAVLGRKKRKKRLVAFAILLVALFGAFFWGINYLIHTLTRESTDDAFLEGHVIAVGPKVAGPVLLSDSACYRAKISLGYPDSSRQLPAMPRG